MMQFTLSHEDIRSALAEHIRKKGVIGPIEFTIKTSRKGNRRSTAFVTVTDTPQQLSINLTNQPDDSVKAHINKILSENMEEETEEEDLVEEPEEIQSIQSKRLFA